MKLSEYVSMLQRVVDDHGDINCVTWTDDDLSKSGGYFEAATQKETERLIQSSVSNFACVYEDSKGQVDYATINDRGYIDCEPATVFIVERINY